MQDLIKKLESEKEGALINLFAYKKDYNVTWVDQVKIWELVYKKIMKLDSGANFEAGFVLGIETAIKEIKKFIL